MAATVATSLPAFVFVVFFVRYDDEDSQVVLDSVWATAEAAELRRKRAIAELQLDGWKPLMVTAPVGDEAAPITSIFGVLPLPKRPK